MNRRFRVACIQVSASQDFRKNIARIHPLIKMALKKKPCLIALPENFAWRGASLGLPAAAAQTPLVIRDFCKLAGETKTAFLLGSLIEPSSEPGKYFNTSVLISEKGIVKARYRKIHLFKIGLARVRTDESRHIVRGTQPVVSKIGGVLIGLSICYDIRFPELFRWMTSRGAKILCVPSNFTETTGKAHWEVLLRARAIENQAFLIAPAQAGVSPSSKIKSFGTSLIIDPWGKVLARGSRHQEEVIFADLDLRAQTALRSAFPVLKHRILKEVF